MPNPLHCTVFLFLSLFVSGIGQTFWMRSKLSMHFNGAIDREKTFRNKRLFGANKTWRGLVFMVPATGVSFVLILMAMKIGLSDQLQLWPLSNLSYFMLGCWTGLGFMLIELPNSFIKRQLDITPGAPALGNRGRKLFFVLDQVDSIAGGLLAVFIFVPVPLSTAVILLLLGAVTHYVFNFVLMHMGLRARAA